MARRVLIDTDIGTDVDDLWTLAMLPSLSDVRLEAVTVVYGDTEIRARLAAGALRAMGVHAPVYRGCETAMSGKSVVWAGHEGVAIDELPAATHETGHAVDVMIELAAANPGTLEIIAIGPLTNIATAIGRDASFAVNLRRLYVMGGEFRIGWPEHNFASDTTATEIVLGCGAPMTIVPLDQTLRVPVTSADVDRIAESHPLGRLMAGEARRFWKWLSGLRDGIPGDRSYPHDPLTLLALTEPSLFTCEPSAVTLEADGRTHRVADPTSPIDVVVDLEPEGSHRAFMRSLGC